MSELHKVHLPYSDKPNQPNTDTKGTSLSQMPSHAHCRAGSIAAQPPPTHAAAIQNNSPFIRILSLTAGKPRRCVFSLRHWRGVNRNIKHTVAHRLAYRHKDGTEATAGEARQPAGWGLHGMQAPRPLHVSKRLTDIFENLCLGTRRAETPPEGAYLCWSTLMQGSQPSWDEDGPGSAPRAKGQNPSPPSSEASPSVWGLENEIPW